MIDDILKEQERTGIIESVVDDDKSMVFEKTSCLPHRPVVREDRDTTKTPVVFDASTKLKGGICMNDALEAGPNLLHSFFDKLPRFRSHK